MARGGKEGPVLINCYQAFYPLQLPGLIFILCFQNNCSSMKWVITNNKKSLLQEYHLTKQGQTKAIVKYNPVQKSARISIGDKHRLFFIESARSLSGKFIFKNEYGIEVGGMNNGRMANEGTIAIESKKFTYKINNNPLAELSIYDGDTHLPLISCGLAAGIKGIALSQQGNNPDSNCLLLGLCWFLFLPVAKENIVEYAA